MIFVYLASIIAGILLGVTESINKKITEKKYSSFAYSFIQNSFNFLIYLALFLFIFKLPQNITPYLYAFVFTVFIMIGNVLLIKAYKTEDVSAVTILGKSNLVVAFVIGIILLAEPTNFLNILGVAAIILGIIIIFYENKKLVFSFGLLAALIAGISWGISAYFRKVALRDFDVIAFIMINQLIASLILSCFSSTRRDIFPIFAKYKKQISLSRLSAVSSLFLLNWSMQKGNISIVNTNIETFYLLSTVLIGIVLFREKRNIAKKLAGSLLCILGIILLNFF